MTTAEAKSAARARIRAFLDAREAYADSLPPGTAPHMMRDEITRQARDSGGMPLNPAPGVTYTVNVSSHNEAVPLLASDLAVLAGDEG